MTHDTSVARDNADDENNEELNTSSHPIPTRGPQFIIQEDTPSPPAHDDTPLLSSSSRQNYSAIIKPPIVTINDGLESSLRPAPVVRLTDIREEDENGLTVSLPASLSPPPEQEGIRPAGAQSHRQLPITDLDEDDDDTYQAKLLAMQQEARRRRKIRRTISGALDITEDLGVAILGSENLSRACDHVPSTPQPSTPVQSRRTSSGILCSVCVVGAHVRMYFMYSTYVHTVHTCTVHTYYVHTYSAYMYCIYSTYIQSHIHPNFVYLYALFTHSGHVIICVKFV